MISKDLITSPLFSLAILRDVTGDAGLSVVFHQFPLLKRGLVLLSSSPQFRGIQILMTSTLLTLTRLC